MKVQVQANERRGERYESYGLKRRRYEVKGWMKVKSEAELG